MRIRQPGMHWPHRHFHRERQQESNKYQNLRRQRQWQLVIIQYRETAAGSRVQVNECHQHQQRSQQRVQKEFDCRIHAIGAAPNADDQEHRDQRGFPEHVEQNRIERGKHTVDDAGHDQQRTHILRHPVADHLPSGDDHQRRGKAVEQNQRHGDAVHPQVIMNVEALDPGVKLDKLHGAQQRVEAAIQRQRHQQARY